MTTVPDYISQAKYGLLLPFIVQDEPSAAWTMEKAIEAGFEEASMFYHAAEIQLELGNADKAERLASRALHLNPNFAIAGEQRLVVLLQPIDRSCTQ